MAESTAYVFPGQGSQAVGMGHDLYKNFRSARAIFDQADEALDFSLSKLCFEGPEEELRQTINAQPALATVSFACLEVARETGNCLSLPVFVAGHSLGEYTALAAAGVLDFSTTVYLTRERGRLMHQAGLSKPGSMVAILGLDEVSVIEVCDRTNTWIANINCPGQIVISGEKENLAKATNFAKSSGARRTIPLQVSGAFHTPLMQSAFEGMSQALSDLTLREPIVPVVANTTAQPITNAQSIKEELLNQLCHCVHWQRSVEYMTTGGVNTFIEIGPGQVLSGLIKRINSEVRTLNISNVLSIQNILDQY